MANFVKVLKTKDLANGAKKTVFAAGKRVMVANVDGNFFAIDDTCNHAGCSLGTEGALSGKVVTCGCHGSQFDVSDGHVLAPPATKGQQSYEVKLEGDDIMIAV